MLSTPVGEKPARAVGARVRMLAIEARVDRTGAIVIEGETSSSCLSYNYVKKKECKKLKLKLPELM